MAAFVVAQFDIKDAEARKQYLDSVKDVFAKFGGEFLVQGGESEQLEGTSRSRVSIIRFPDMASARGFYGSDEYKKAIETYGSASERDRVLVDGP